MPHACPSSPDGLFLLTKASVPCPLLAHSFIKHAKPQARCQEFSLETKHPCPSARTLVGPAQRGRTELGVPVWSSLQAGGQGLPCRLLPGFCFLCSLRAGCSLAKAFASLPSGACWRVSCSMQQVCVCVCVYTPAAAGPPLPSPPVCGGERRVSCLEPSPSLSVFLPHHSVDPPHYFCSCSVAVFNSSSWRLSVLPERYLVSVCHPSPSSSCPGIPPPCSSGQRLVTAGAAPRSQEPRLPSSHPASGSVLRGGDRKGARRALPMHRPPACSGGHWHPSSACAPWLPGASSLPSQGAGLSRAQPRGGPYSAPPRPPLCGPLSPFPPH